MDRRKFLCAAGASAASAWVSAGSSSASCLAQAIGGAGAPHKVQAADYSLRIEELKLELAPGISVKTVGYNGTVPGPLLRMKHGVPITIDVENKTSIDELVHWHGFDISSLSDGAMEEGSPMVPAGGKLRYAFTPNLTGSRWYHTHAMAAKDLSRSTYTGQFGFAYVEPAQNAGDYDHEVFLAVHHWEPSLEMSGPPVNACEVAYKYATFNDKMLSASAPLKVKPKQRVLFHLLNASATQNVSLALPGHQFEVIALDGNAVPHPAKVNTISLAVAERIDAVVEMNQPGVWILGSTDKRERESGLGLPIEYAGSVGAPVWKDSASLDWDYLKFGNASSQVTQADETITMIFGKKPGAAKDGMDRWMINGNSWPDGDPVKVSRGKRYRLSMLNASPEVHPVHLHRHSFEIMSINGKTTSGIVKDTINLNAFGRAEVDFVANNPGPTLFHCHQQLHMDYGFMQLIQYA